MFLIFFYFHSSCCCLARTKKLNFLSRLFVMSPVTTVNSGWIVWSSELRNSSSLSPSLLEPFPMWMSEICKEKKGGMKELGLCA